MRKRFLFLFSFLVLIGLLGGVSANVNESLVAWWSLNETSGSTALEWVAGQNGTYAGDLPNAVSGVSANTGNAQRFDGTDDDISTTLTTGWTATDEFSGCVWINTTYVGSKSIMGDNIGVSGINVESHSSNTAEIQIRDSDGHVRQIDGAVTINDGNWHLICFTYDGANNLTLWVDGSIDEASDDGTTLTNNLYNGNWHIGSKAGSVKFIGDIDEAVLYNQTLSGADIDTLYNGGNGVTYQGSSSSPNIVLELFSPSNNTIISSDGTNFTANFTIEGSNTYNYTWKNATYYVWYENGSLLNATSVVLPPLNTTSYTQFIDAFTLGDYYWNVLSYYGNATYDNSLWGSNGNSTLNVGADIQNITYSNSTYETQSQEFIASVELLENSDLFAVKFIYNGTEHSATKTQIDSNSYQLSKTIDIPLTNEEVNVSFYWRYIYALDGDYAYQNSTSFNQTILPLYFVKCNATYVNTSIRFIVKNETNPNPEINAKFYSSWDYWLGSGDVKKSYAWEDVTETNDTFEFCISLPSLEYSIDAQIDYTASDKVLRTYYIQNGTATNETNNITLYLLPETESTSIMVYVKDYLLNALIERVVKAQRYDTGEGIWKTVELTRTDDTGQGLLHLLEEDADYKFLIEYQGNNVYSSEPRRIVCTSSPCSIEFKVGESSEEVILFNNIDGITYDLSFNNESENIVFVWDDVTGLTSYFRLLVEKQGYKDSTTICDVQSTDTSGSLVCSLANKTGTFITTVYRSASPEAPFSQLITELKNGFATFGSETYAWGIFFILLMFFVGLAGGVVTALMSLFAGIIILATMGVTALGWTSIVLSIIIIGYFIIQLKN